MSLSPLQILSNDILGELHAAGSAIGIVFLCYGAYIVLSLATLYLALGLQHAKSRNSVLIANGLLLCLITVLVALLLACTLRQITLGNNFDGPLDKMALSLTVFKNFVFLINHQVMFWRITHLIPLANIPLRVGMFTSFVMLIVHIGLLVASDTVQDKFEVAFSLSFLLPNALILLHIGYKLWCHMAIIQKNLELSANIMIRANKICCLLLETGVINSFFWVAGTFYYVEYLDNVNLLDDGLWFVGLIPLAAAINANLVMLISVSESVETDTYLKKLVAIRYLLGLAESPDLLPHQVEPYHLRYDRSSQPDLNAITTPHSLTHLTPYTLKHETTITPVFEALSTHPGSNTIIEERQDATTENAEALPESSDASSVLSRTRQIRLQQDADGLQEQVRAILSAVNNSNEGMQVAMSTMMAHIRSLESQMNSDWARCLRDEREPPPTYE